MSFFKDVGNKVGALSQEVSQKVDNSKPTKGVDAYSFIGIPNCTVEFSVPGKTVKNDPSWNFWVQKLEIESDKIPGRLKFDGEFRWKVIRDNKEVMSGWNTINTLSGDLVDGNMLKISATQSKIFNDIVITYGFYDAGSGQFGLTNRHQCYVTVTKTHATWQGDLAPKDSENAKKPFGTFALPAPHDPGMNTMNSVLALLGSPGKNKVLETLTHNVPGVSALANLGQSQISNIIYGLAITQKDEIARMCEMGCRYFEYRPAYMEDKIRQYAPFPDKLWFQHACIPGTLFEEFIEDIVEFLDAHPTEIICTRICWDGVIPSCKKPTNDDVKNIYKQYTDKSKTAIKVGDKNSLGKKIDDLRNSHTRLILLTSDVSKYDSYDDTANATFDGKSIVERYKNMTVEEQKKRWYTVLQCQATATNIKNVLAYSVASSNASTSCLMETKARCDSNTLWWIKDNAIKNFDKSLLVVVMNDFIDGATVDTTIELSKQRFK